MFTCPVFFVSNTLNRLSITISALHLHKHKLKSVHCDFGFYFGKSWVTNSFSWILLIVSSGKSILKEFHRVITSSSVNWCCWKKKDKTLFLLSDTINVTCFFSGFSTFFSSFSFFFSSPFSSGLYRAIEDMKSLKNRGQI